MSRTLNPPTVRRVATLAAAPILVLATVVPAAAAPLDPDHSFGRNHNGTVHVDYYQGLGPLLQTVAVSGRSTLVSGREDGGITGSHFVVVAQVGRHGRWRNSFGGSLEEDGGVPKVASTFRSGHLFYAIGRAGPSYSYSGSQQKTVKGYAFVAAFARHHRHGPHWGSERFYSGGRGLERLKEVPMHSVAAGAIDQAHRVVVVGRHDGGIVITRLTAHGVVDRSFGSFGSVRLFGGAPARASDTQIDAQNRIMIAGQRTINGYTQGFVTRLNPDGSMSSSWDGDGVRMVGASGSAVRGIEPLGGGRWVVGYHQQRHDKVRLIKLGALGGQLTSFGHHGYVSTRCPARHRGAALTALTTTKSGPHPSRILATMACRSHHHNRQRAGIWLTNGHPVPALRPTGIRRLPWKNPTLDATYTSGTKLMYLHHRYLTRLYG